MEGPYSTLPSSEMAQSPFFYYNPASKLDHRQHAQFSTYPNGVPSNVQHFQQKMHATEPMIYHPSPIAKTVMFQRLAPSTAQVQIKTKALFNQVHLPSTPIASPQAIPLRADAFLFGQSLNHYNPDAEYANADLHYPVTPSLSSSGSFSDSPCLNHDLLPTPVDDHTIFGLQYLEGVKQGCEGEVRSENLAGSDWARMGSPPMTPGKFRSLCDV